MDVSRFAPRLCRCGLFSFAVSAVFSFRNFANTFFFHSMRSAHSSRDASFRSLCRVFGIGLFLFTGIGLWGSVYDAKAEGFALSEWSARGMSLGSGFGAGMVARADDPSAVAYNTAGITQIPGTAMQAGLTLTMLHININRSDSAELKGENASQIWPIPHMYLTHQLNDRVWLGFGSFIRYGLGSKFPSDWGRPSASTPETLPYFGGVQASGIQKSSTLLTNTFNPTIAIKLNDVWSLGFGVSYTYGYVTLNRQYHFAKHGVSLAKADARLHSDNGYAFGFNVGIHARFNDQWSAGLSYRSKENMKFTGSGRFSYSGRYGAALSSLMHNTGMSGTLCVPDIIALGVKYQPIPQLSLGGDVVYTVWSRYRSFSIKMDAPDMNDIVEVKNWHDTWAFTVNAEYRPYDWLALRAGFTYETSPLKNTPHTDYLVPTNGRTYWTVGVGFKHENWTVDLAYAYVQMRDLGFTDEVSNGIYSRYDGNTTCGHANNVSLTIGYKF